MAKIALINSGVVVNVTLADLVFAQTLPGYEMAIDITGTEVGVGWGYDGQAFVAPAQDIAEVRDKHWANIKTERDRRTQQGGYQVAGKWFHSDTFSRTQQMGLVMMGANIPADLQWKTMDGSFVTMTQTLANQIFMAAAQSDTNLFVRAEQLRLLMENDPINFNITEHSWPVIFGE